MMKTKVTYLDPQHFRVETPTGECFELTFARMIPMGEVETMCEELADIFDSRYEGNVQSMWRKLPAEARGKVGKLLCVLPDKLSERERIGRRIRQLREERGMLGKELAELVGIDPANLSRLEKGKYSVGLDILCRIAAALGKKVMIN